METAVNYFKVLFRHSPRNSEENHEKYLRIGGNLAKIRNVLVFNPL
jgi:hypothetical protein